MIIVEGPDCSGKTTFCKALMEGLQHRWPAYSNRIYAHFTRLPPNFDYYWNYVDRMSKGVIQDRFHMSEIIYSKVRGQVTFLDEETYRMVDARLALLGCIQVLITADTDLIASRFGGKEEMYNIEQTKQAASLYMGYRSAFPTYRFSIDHHFHGTPEKPYATDEFLDRVLSHYDTRQRAILAISSRRPAAI